MTNNYQEQGHRSYLRRIARNAMRERGLLPDFTEAELSELASIQLLNTINDRQTRDLRHLQWCSIDNHDSRDLDQLSYGEALQGGNIKILVAIADVASLVPKDSLLDKHAKHNTSTVYTAAEIFPMLPERLSTDLTSLNPHADRLAIVVEMTIAPDGNVLDAGISKALVRNQAKLSYLQVSRWLDGDIPTPEEISSVKGLEANLKLQDKIAQQMKLLRHERGALEFETIHAQPRFENDTLQDLDTDQSNRAKDIVADFMIAVNGVVARYLEAKGFPSIRRIVRTPKRWDRIVELALQHGHKLPLEPDPKALNAFLSAQKALDPLRFPDLSISVIKLLGSGEYDVEVPGETNPGHFGLAVKDYTHSTAPNRRYPDLLTHRMLHAALEGKALPYSAEELDALAAHCSKTEDLVNKIERQVLKSAAALLLQSRIGEQFKGIITGSSEKGTWVRLFKLPVEGRVVEGFNGLDVGERLRVELIRTDVERGFIDFKRVP